MTASRTGFCSIAYELTNSKPRCFISWLKLVGWLRLDDPHLGRDSHLHGLPPRHQDYSLEFYYSCLPYNMSDEPQSQETQASLSKSRGEPSYCIPASLSANACRTKPPSPNGNLSRVQGRAEAQDDAESVRTRTERLGRERPEKLKSLWMEVGFCYSIISSEFMTVSCCVVTELRNACMTRADEFGHRYVGIFHIRF